MSLVKRVIFISSGLNTGGAERALYELIRMIRGKELAVMVVSLTGRGQVGDDISSLGVPVVEVDIKHPSGLPVAIRALVRSFTQFDPDIVQGWMYHGNLAASLCDMMVRSRRRAVLFAVRHCVYDLRAEKLSVALSIRLGALLSRRAAKIVYNTPLSARQHEALGYRAEASVVIPNGFDTDEFRPSQEARIRWRRRLRAKDDEIVIGMVGRLHPIKDHNNFFTAAVMLRKKLDRVRFVLVGAGLEEGNPKVTSMLRQGGLGEAVTLLGEQRDIVGLNNAFDVATLSSNSEAFPNVIGEAMSCGVPCVATAVGEVPDLIGDTGKVVPVRDPGALADAWRALVDLGPDGRRLLGVRARARVRERYSIHTASAHFLQLYDEVSAAMALQ